MVAEVERGQSVTLTLGPTRQAYALQIEGKSTVQNVTLSRHDAGICLSIALFEHFPLPALHCYNHKQKKRTPTHHAFAKDKHASTVPLPHHSSQKNTLTEIPTSSSSR